MLATALLLPVASRAIGPGMRLAPHSGTVEAFVRPTGRHVAANLVKSEAEFLAYGAMSEGANVVLNRVVTRTATRGVTRGLNGVSHAGPAGATRGGIELIEGSAEPEAEAGPAGAELEAAPWPLYAPGNEFSLGPVGSWAQRVHEQNEAAAPALVQRGGAVQQLQQRTK